MEYNRDKVDEITLALLYLTTMACGGIAGDGWHFSATSSWFAFVILLRVCIIV